MILNTHESKRIKSSLVMTKSCRALHSNSLCHWTCLIRKDKLDLQHHSTGRECPPRKETNGWGRLGPHWSKMPYCWLGNLTWHRSWKLSEELHSDGCLKGHPLGCCPPGRFDTILIHSFLLITVKDGQTGIHKDVKKSCLKLRCVVEVNTAMTCLVCCCMNKTFRCYL